MMGLKMDLNKVKEILNSSPGFKMFSEFDYNNSAFNEYEKLVLGGDFIVEPTRNPSTQKARGICFLQQNKLTILSEFTNWNIPKHYLFRAGTQFATHSFNFPVFARPCPTVPRHGFVDSIVCKSAIELNALSMSTSQVESEAEILVVRPINSIYNAILNGGTITFGLGNDGATSGKNCHYFYIGDDPLNEMLHLEDFNLIAPDEVPFYEFVFDRNDQTKPTCLVQVRSAPSTPRVKDFVPAPVVVKNIVKAEGDLLDWESKLKTLNPADTIIDHMGGSLSSHYAIHAVVNKLPIFTTYLPSLGSYVEPTVVNTDITLEDKEKFVKSFSRGFINTPMIFKKVNFMSDIQSIMKSVVILALGTLHNYSQIHMAKDFEILGAALGLFCRVAFAISAGESRYGKKYGKDMADFSAFYKTLPSGDRAPCYEYMTNQDLSECVGAIPLLYRIFSEFNWGSSYGGPKWAACTLKTMELFNACVAGEITRVVELFNSVINSEHNGGRYLDKVISINYFDQAAEKPSTFVLANLHLIIDLLSNVWNTEVNNDLCLQSLVIPKISSTVKVGEVIDGEEEEEEESVQEQEEFSEYSGTSSNFYNPTQYNPINLNIKKQNIKKQNIKKQKSLESKNPYLIPFPLQSGSDNITEIAVNIDNVFVNLKLAKPIEASTISTTCLCSLCVKDKIPLWPGSGWWYAQNGKKIISKHLLTKMIKNYKKSLNPIVTPVTPVLPELTISDLNIGNFQQQFELKLKDINTYTSAYKINISFDTNGSTYSYSANKEDK